MQAVEEEFPSHFLRGMWDKSYPLPNLHQEVPHGLLNAPIILASLAITEWDVVVTDVQVSCAKGNFDFY